MSEHHHHHDHEPNQSTGSSEPYSRRIFMQQGMVFLSMATTVPLFMQRSASGIMLPVGSLVSSKLRSENLESQGTMQALH